MDLIEKLAILTDSAKYDVACTSSGVDRAGNGKDLGSACAPGICHTFSSDGRCVSLLKVLLSNCCAYDCVYCVNRRSAETPRASFTPRELAELTIEFYRRNYIEGLFLSSAILRDPDTTMEQMIRVLELLRNEYRFRGYIHAKAIPGADSSLVTRLGLLADRISINIELPSEKSLSLLAPQKSKSAILTPMRLVRDAAAQNRAELVRYRAAPRFAPAGQSTQMMIGASPEDDLHILRLTQSLYQKYSLKRVFYSAYIPVAEHSLLPALDTKPPLLREHRLYQADWLLRFYHFTAEEILDDAHPNFNPYLDPKCNWAIHNLQLFPVDVNRCRYEMLLRVPGIGVRSAQRILQARRCSALSLEDLKRIGVVLKRARHFIVCKNFSRGLPASPEQTVRALLDPGAFQFGEQLCLFSSPALSLAAVDAAPALAAHTMREEAVSCLTKEL